MNIICVLHPRIIMLSTAVLQIFQQRCRESLTPAGNEFPNNSTFTFDLTMRKSGFETFGSFPFRLKLARLRTNKILLMKRRREFLTQPPELNVGHGWPRVQALSGVDFYNFGYQSPPQGHFDKATRSETELLWTRPAVLSCESSIFNQKSSTFLFLQPR